MSESKIVFREDGTVIFQGAEATSVYQAMVVRQGLKACKDGFRLNRAYTPKNLMAMVQKITGKKFSTRKYDEAIAAMTSWIDSVKVARESVA